MRYRIEATFASLDANNVGDQIPPSAEPIRHGGHSQNRLSNSVTGLEWVPAITNFFRIAFLLQFQRY
jgi:hypothetical protein